MMGPYVVKVRPYFFWLLVMAFILSISGAVYGIAKSKGLTGEYKTCADFTTKAEAQAAYDAGAKHLDGNDYDNIPCESISG